MREERTMAMPMIFMTVSMTLFGFLFRIAVCSVVVMKVWIVFGYVFALDFFFDLLVVAAIFTPKCQRHQPRHIKRGHSGGEKTHDPENFAVAIWEILTCT